MYNNHAKQPTPCEKQTISINLETRNHKYPPDNIPITFKPVSNHKPAFSASNSKIS